MTRASRPHAQQAELFKQLDWAAIMKMVN
jgi:hypothetical protein